MFIMPEPYAEGGVQDSEFGLSIEAISVLDVSEQAYFDACADYAERPSQDNLTKINDFMLEQAMAFSKALGTIAEDNSVEAYVTEGSALFREKESRRVDFLNAITDSESFWLTNVEMPEENEAPDEASAMQKVLDYWTLRNNNSLQHDTSQFVEFVQNTPVAERFKRNEALKQHAIHVAKIAVGTSIALLFTNRFKRS